MGLLFGTKSLARRFLTTFLVVTLTAGMLVIGPRVAYAMSIYITITFQNDTAIILEVENADTIESVKLKMEEELLSQYQIDLSPELQMLYFNGKLLDNERTLQDYNIQKEAHLTLLLNEIDFGSLESESDASGPGWIWEDDVLSITGEVAISTSDNFGHTLELDEGARLIILPDVHFTNEGTITNKGIIDNQGVLNNRAGTINNQGTITNLQSITAADYMPPPYLIGQDIISAPGTYTASNGGAESTEGHQFQWYRIGQLPLSLSPFGTGVSMEALDAGSQGTPIAGATAATYQPTSEDFGAWLYLKTTPRGYWNLPGEPVESALIQAGTMFVASVKGMGVAQVDGGASLIVYEHTAVAVTVAHNEKDAAITWNDGGVGGSFENLHSADTTYIMPANPPGLITLEAVFKEPVSGDSTDDSPSSATTLPQTDDASLPLVILTVLLALAGSALSVRSWRVMHSPVRKNNLKEHYGEDELIARWEPLIKNRY